MPYPNEHSCRIKDPSKFQKDSFRRVEREHEGKKYTVILAKPINSDDMEEQAYRYPKNTWSEDAARTHCKDHNGKFEPAASNTANSNSFIYAKMPILTNVYAVNPNLFLDFFNIATQDVHALEPLQNIEPEKVNSTAILKINGILEQFPSLLQTFFGGICSV